MPINKATGEKICINNCGPLTQAKSRPKEIISHFIPSISRRDDEALAVTLDMGFSLDIWACSECGYVEFYDFDLKGV